MERGDYENVRIILCNSRNIITNFRKFSVKFMKILKLSEIAGNIFRKSLINFAWNLSWFWNNFEEVLMISFQNTKNFNKIWKFHKKLWLHSIRSLKKFQIKFVKKYWRKFSEKFFILRSGTFLFVVFRDRVLKKLFGLETWLSSMFVWQVPEHSLLMSVWHWSRSFFKAIGILF